MYIKTQITSKAGSSGIELEGDVSIVVIFREADNSMIDDIFQIKSRFATKSWILSTDWKVAALTEEEMRRRVEVNFVSFCLFSNSFCLKHI